MDKKLPAVFRSLPTIAQNLHINISLKDWPATVAVWAVCGTIVGVTAIIASAKAKDGKTSSKEEPPEEGWQDDGDELTEGSSDEADDPFLFTITCHEGAIIVIATLNQLCFSNTK